MVLSFKVGSGGRGSGITFSEAVNLAIRTNTKVYFDEDSGECFIAIESYTYNYLFFRYYACGIVKNVPQPV